MLALQITALQEIPPPPGAAQVRIEVEIEQPAEPDDSQPESDPVDDALSGAAKVARGLVVGACKLVSGALDALTDDEKEVD